MCATEITIETASATSAIPTTPACKSSPPPLVRECIAETLGTAMIVVFGCGSVTAGGASLFGVSFAFGTVVYLMVECLGDVSGAHFNPAVTLTCYLSAGLPLYKAPLYVAAQVAGAFVGGAFLKGIAPSVDGRSVYNSGLAIPDALTVAQAFCWEA